MTLEEQGRAEGDAFLQKKPSCYLILTPPAQCICACFACACQRLFHSPETLPHSQPHPVATFIFKFFFAM